MRRFGEIAGLMPHTNNITAVALIPARAGSVRVPHKNIRPLAGHPLIAYSIAAAKASGVFDSVIVSTDSEEYAAIARHYGAEVPFLRDKDMASSTAADIDWVMNVLGRLGEAGRNYDAYSILRPTSPFRKAATIQRAMQTFLAAEGADSLRAVEPVEQHPGKMWVIRGERMTPLMPLTPPEAPWHSQQKPTLPPVYVQNASLEIAWTQMTLRTRSIAGHTLVPFLTEGDEGVDINGPQDWFWVEHLMQTGGAILPPVDVAPFQSSAG
jgi:CMP-N,N'-diacetyllegionaminic acid synthase